jgi:hypothetical protein
MVKYKKKYTKKLYRKKRQRSYRKIKSRGGKRKKKLKGGADVSQKTMRIHGSNRRSNCCHGVLRGLGMNDPKTEISPINLRPYYNNCKEQTGRWYGTTCNTNLQVMDNNAKLESVKQSIINERGAELERIKEEKYKRAKQNLISHLKDNNNDLNNTPSNVANDTDGLPRLALQSEHSGKWQEAIAVSRTPDGKVKFHFVGFDPMYDEDLDPDNDRIQTLGWRAANNLIPPKK